MLPYILALAVATGSFAIYMAAFFFPEVHRKGDLVWSGVGLFYALVLWFCAGRITGAVLLGQMASVTLLGWFGWQALVLRRQTTPAMEQTRVSGEKLTSVSKLSGRMTSLFKGKAAPKPTAAPPQEVVTTPAVEIPATALAEPPAPTAIETETKVEGSAIADTAPLTPTAAPAPPVEKPKKPGLAGRFSNLFKAKPKQKPAPQPEKQPATPPSPAPESVTSEAIADTPVTPLEAVSPLELPVEAVSPLEVPPAEPPTPLSAPVEMPEQVEEMPAAAALEGATAELEVSEDDDFDFEELEELEATPSETLTPMQATATVSLDTEETAKPAQQKAPAKSGPGVAKETRSPGTGLLTKLQEGVRGLFNFGQSSKKKPPVWERPPAQTPTEAGTAPEDTTVVADSEAAIASESATAEAGTAPEDNTVMAQTTIVVETEVTLPAESATPEVSVTTTAAEATPPHPAEAEGVDTAEESTSAPEAEGRLTPEPVEEYAPEVETEAQQVATDETTATAEGTEESQATTEVPPAHPADSEGSEEEGDLSAMRTRRQDPAVVEATPQPGEVQSQPTQTEEDNG